MLAGLLLPTTRHEVPRNRLNPDGQTPLRLGAVLAVMLVSAVLAIAIIVVVLEGIQAAASFGQ
jgi:hypothetical protein